jgi:hypothetical protein
MSTWGKTVTSVLIALFLTLALLIPQIANAQTISSYVSPTGRMSTSYSLKIYSPDNQTVYNNSMYLNFTLKWTYDLIPVGDFELVGDYAYKIDDNPFVSIISNQSSGDRYATDSTFKVNPSFSYLVNISSLSNGYHRVEIKASLYFGGNTLLDASSSPFYFNVQNPTPSPTPPSATNDLIPSLTITLIVVAVLVVAIAFLLLYRRNRKTPDTNQ